MRSLMRTGLIWLLMLAVPAQALAAATMLLCGPAHDRMHQALSAHDEHHAHDSHASADAHTAHHIGDAAVDGVADAPQKFPQLGQYTCSACAACCSVMGLPSTPVAVAEPAAVSSEGQPLTSRAPSFFTEGIERPPRTNVS